MKLLLVEDDPGVRDGLADLLEEIAPVQVSATVVDALRVLAAEPIGLVFADLNIGDGMGGLMIVAEAQKRRIPVIICTGVSRTEAVTALGDLSPDAIVTKPFAIDEVVAIATRLFRK